MKVERLNKIETATFELGDVIKFKLNDGEKVEAMAVKQEDDGMVFLLVDCLEQEYSMNATDTTEGGYEASDLREKLNGEILDRFPQKIKARMVPFDNGDPLRLPTEKEIFGENPWGEDEHESVERFKGMKKRRNRMAFQGNNGDPEWYWLQNPVENSAAFFAGVSSHGLAYCYSASYAFGVRPAFKI